MKKQAACNRQPAFFAWEQRAENSKWLVSLSLQIPGFVLVVARCQDEEQKSCEDQRYDKRTHVGQLLS